MRREAVADPRQVSTQVLCEVARIGRHYRLGLVLTTESHADVDRWCSTIAATTRRPIRGCTLWAAAGSGSRARTSRDGSL